MSIYLLFFSVIVFGAVVNIVSSKQYSDELFFIFVVLISIFSGLRYETGQDWEAYKLFFDNIDTSVSVFRPYSDAGYSVPVYEIGYYLLNYLVKVIGGGYSTVFFLSSILSGLSIFRVGLLYRINNLYFLACYMGYSFLLLNFAQVRQSLALSVFLIGCTLYLKGGKKLFSIFVCSLSVLFQVTAVMYVLIFMVVLAWPDTIKKTMAVVICILCFIGFYSIYSFVDMESFMLLFAITGGLESKINVYLETQSNQGFGARVYSLYLFLLVLYLAVKLDEFNVSRHVIIVKFAIASIMLSLFFAIVVPGIYPLYSRAYVLAGVFQAWSIGLISLRSKTFFDMLVVGMTLLAAVYSYVRLLIYYEQEYIPYKSILVNFQ